MAAFLGGGCGGKWNIWGMGGPFDSEEHNSRRRSRKSNESKSSDSLDATGGSGYQFPAKQAFTSASLALAGDTIAQLRQRWLYSHDTMPSTPHHFKDVMGKILPEHDWLRALRMTSYGFLLYGPGSYAWYQFLDHCMPKQTVENILAKVLLNQIVLGPIVIGVVFAWNNLWLGKVSELPLKYQKDALPALFTGFRFWIPVSILNFWVVPLHARVAFMSIGSIFWNFFLSTTMSK